MLDVGTTKKIAQGAIKIVPGLSAITEDGAVFEGGNKAKFDAIIFATGYRPNYRDFLEYDDINAANDGTPNEQLGTRLFILSDFQSPVSGLLREISKEAVRIAGHIVRQRKELAVSRA